jgi:signal transduction histidine kinase
MDATIARWRPDAGTDPLVPDAWRTGQALAELSHDLRTPLNAILGFAQLLADQAVPVEELATVARDIVASGELLLRQVIDVLLLASLEAGHVPLVGDPTDLGTAARRALERMGPALAAAGQAIDWLAAGDLPLARADGAWLDTALDRLLEDLQRAAPRGATLVARARVAAGHVGVGFRIRGAQPRDSIGEFRLGLICAHRAVALMGGSVTRTPPEDGPGWNVWLPIAASTGE